MVNMMVLEMVAHQHFQFHYHRIKLLAGQFTLKTITMDYLCIGSNGFAQLGSSDFCEKNEVEMKYLLEYLLTNHPIPEEFSTLCWYKEKWFRHDFGDYSEIVLIYKDRILEDWEETETEKFDRFWDWFNDIESVDLESEIITRNIEAKYLESCQLTKT